MVRVSIKLLYPFSTCHIPKIFVALLPQLIPDLYAAVVFSPSAHLPLTFVSILRFPCPPLHPLQLQCFTTNVSRITQSSDVTAIQCPPQNRPPKTDGPQAQLDMYGGSVCTAAQCFSWICWGEREKVGQGMEGEGMEGRN